MHNRAAAFSEILMCEIASHGTPFWFIGLWNMHYLNLLFVLFSTLGRLVNQTRSPYYLQLQRQLNMYNNFGINQAGEHVTVLPIPHYGRYLNIMALIKFEIKWEI